MYRHRFRNDVLRTAREECWGSQEAAFRAVRDWLQKQPDYSPPPAKGKRGRAGGVTSLRQYQRYESGDVNERGGVNKSEPSVSLTLKAFCAVFGLTEDKLLEPPTPQNMRIGLEMPDAQAMLDRFEQWQEIKRSIEEVDPRYLVLVLRSPQSQSLPQFLSRLAFNLKVYHSGGKEAIRRAAAPELVWVPLNRSGISWASGAHWMDRIVESLPQAYSVYEPVVALQKAASKSPLFIVLGGKGGLNTSHSLTDDEFNGLVELLETTLPSVLGDLKGGFPIRIMIPVAEESVPREQLSRNAVEENFFGQLAGYIESNFPSLRETFSKRQIQARLVPLLERATPRFEQQYKRLLAAGKAGCRKISRMKFTVLKPLTFPVASDVSDWLREDCLFSTPSVAGPFPCPKPSNEDRAWITREYQKALNSKEFQCLADVFLFILDRLQDLEDGADGRGGDDEEDEEDEHNEE